MRGKGGVGVLKGSVASDVAGDTCACGDWSNRAAAAHLIMGKE